MRVLVTADLHYDVLRSRAPAEELARRALATGGDVLVLVGDTAGRDLSPMRQCLGLFADFPGRRYLVPGNHCLWTDRGECSMKRYREVLPALAAEEGFAVLDHEPLITDDVALVGSVGWYDYAFRDESLGVPVPFYEAKIAPGAAARLEGHEALVAAHRHELTDRHLEMGVRWMDGTHVRLPMTDREFVGELVNTLTGQLATAAAQARRVVAFIHHLPFAELVPADRPDRFAFAAAYMGSPRLGEALLACPKLTDVYCGHSHWPARLRIGNVNVVNIGSTYIQKQLEVLDLTGLGGDSGPPAFAAGTAPHAEGTVR